MTFDPERDERKAAISGVDMISNIDGAIHDAGYWRMVWIQCTRRHVAELRERLTPRQMLRIELLVHGWGDRGPRIDRAYAAFIEIALIQPSLNVRETWYIAYRDARRSDSEEWRRLLAAFPSIRYT